jgi:glycosyltransferase involved in cell wall biosynthesis
VRVLILNWKDLEHPAAGGAEVFTENVARELVSRGHEVTLFVARVAGRPELEIKSGVQVIRRGSKLTVYREARRFWQHEANGWADVVVDEVNTRPFLTPRYIDSTPVVALIHQVAREVWASETPFPVSILGRYFFEPRWLRAYRHVRVLTDSPSSAQSLREYGLRDIQPVPLGADPVEVSPLVEKEAEPTIVFLGRLASTKRPHHAISALQHLRAEMPNARLWVLGDGPMRARLEREQHSSVEFFGRVSAQEREDRLARAHVLVATSEREGWGLNVSEAASCGTPTIGYRVSGLVDSVPASGGELVDPNPKALGDALRAFFAGTLQLTPRVSTVPWADVCSAVETQLLDVVAAWSRDRRGVSSSAIADP